MQVVSLQIFSALREEILLFKWLVVWTSSKF